MSIFARAQQEDSLRISLLTCAPGDEIYSLFGHTAIRCENFTRNTDDVYNYGMFSFSTPHFIYRFVKGETDYQLGVVPYSYFEAEYAMRGSDVFSQVLNLTSYEKKQLLLALQENYLPENRTYRYNYFYDNCTTRARDRIEQAVRGKIVYPDSCAGKTFRGIVHEFTVGFPWDQLGIDLCLGRDADCVIGAREQMFSPYYLKKYAAGAYIIQHDGTRRPLVKSQGVIVHASFHSDHIYKQERGGATWCTPFLCAIIFLVLCLFVSWIQYVKRKVWWGWHVLLAAVQGMAGCIIAFLFFFSVHPTVGSNWMLFFLNPIPLFYLPVMIYCGIKGKKDPYHWVNVLYLTLFIAIIPLCGQKFNLSVLPLALGLLICSATYVLVWTKRK